MQLKKKFKSFVKYNAIQEFFSKHKDEDISNQKLNFMKIKIKIICSPGYAIMN